MKTDVVIAIDDLHPEKGWGCDGDLCVAYLKNLWEEFGCKFTLFVPSNYHNKFPLSEHKDWIEFWKKKEWVELAAHGHYHQCERTDIGECEFYELDTREKALQRISECLTEWDRAGYKPKGWRNPGWLAHPEAIKVLGDYFKYTAIHEEHNHGMPWSCKTFFGCDGIDKNDSINLYNNRFMFQSHIAGDWNDNVWNENNYENIREVLRYLSESYKLNFVTLGELI